MDSASDISHCSKLLNELETADKVAEDVLLELARLLEHPPTQTAPRLQKDYQNCATKSEQILGTLFDKIDLSDKQMLNSLLQLHVAYGNFRIAQITYHIENPRDALDVHMSYTPVIAKLKWYDLTPLLPTAGTFGWKHILIHGLVLEERQLFRTSLKLLTQKLHFYAIISTLDRFRQSLDIIQKNGETVSEKIIEKVLDFANDDEELIGMNTLLFNLLLTFTNDLQKAAIMEAIVQDRFKSRLVHNPQLSSSTTIFKLQILISECIMDKADLQEVFIAKLLNHLKCNIIRRKRRHSVEASEENLCVTLEGLISEIVNDADPVELLKKTGEVEVSSKRLQKVYVSQWVQFLNLITMKRTLTPRSSIMILSTCSLLIVTTAEVVSLELLEELSTLITSSIDNTGQRKIDKFFKTCGSEFLLKFTELLSKKNGFLDDFNTPIGKFYRAYFGRHMRYCAMRGYMKGAEESEIFVTNICDKSLDYDKSHVIKCIYLSELAEIMESLKNRGANKWIEIYTGYTQTLSKRLHKFIKRHSFFKKSAEETTNGNSKQEDSHNTVIDSLVCILKISIDHKAQDILDDYGDLMMKLYNLMCTRFNYLVEKIKTGSPTSKSALDTQFLRLMNLYVEYRTMIEPYLCYDINAKITDILLFEKSLTFEIQGGKCANQKKIIYNELKTKLENLQERSEKFSNVFQTVINRQYNSIVDQNLGHGGDIKKEDPCIRKLLSSMKTVGEVSNMLLNHCDLELYDKVLDNIVGDLESCNALDHPRILYSFLILESLIPKQTIETARFESFKEILPRLSCSLIRISKFVELGPSIHSFTRPGSHKSSIGIQCCMYTNCIKIYTLIFSKYPSKATNNLITDAMQMCVSSNLAKYARCSNKTHMFFIQLASAIASLLKAICIGRKEEDILRSSMPIYLSVFSLLMRCIILASDRQKLIELQPSQKNNNIVDSVDQNGIDSEENEIGADDDVCKVYEAHLECLARDVGRMLNNLSFLEVKLVDYAPHLISTYVRDTQRTSCPDFIKKHLDEGIFRIFNLVDAHQKSRQEELIGTGNQRKTTAGHASGSLFEMIHVRLDQASREIFRNMHDNYNRFHRYLGKC